ncbi:MAG: hypothetical protein PWQ41_49 [Bacillota bacterium]|nr:hypothetical protein [Bacillota bacterium]MDK2924275.1 hypothetical protein [Bacillota bacterium]
MRRLRPLPALLSARSDQPESWPCLGGSRSLAGVTPHTINYSLGVWGRRDKLPSDDILAITTMCGHHMISPRLVEKLIIEVKQGRFTPREAALKLSSFCHCGIFNHIRAEKLIRRYAGLEGE